MPGGEPGGEHGGAGIQHHWTYRALECCVCGGSSVAQQKGVWGLGRI